MQWQSPMLSTIRRQWPTALVSSKEPFRRGFPRAIRRIDTIHCSRHSPYLSQPAMRTTCGINRRRSAVYYVRWLPVCVLHLEMKSKESSYSFIHDTCKNHRTKAFRMRGHREIRSRGRQPVLARVVPVLNGVVCTNIWTDSQFIFEVYGRNNISATSPMKQQRKITHCRQTHSHTWRKRSGKPFPSNVQRIKFSEIQFLLHIWFYRLHRNGGTLLGRVCHLMHSHLIRSFECVWQNVVHFAENGFSPLTRCPPPGRVCGVTFVFAHSLKFHPTISKLVSPCEWNQVKWMATPSKSIHSDFDTIQRLDNANHGIAVTLDLKRKLQMRSKHIEIAFHIGIDWPTFICQSFQMQFQLVDSVCACVRIGVRRHCEHCEFNINFISESAQFKLNSARTIHSQCILIASGRHEFYLIYFFRIAFAPPRPYVFGGSLSSKSYR